MATEAMSPYAPQWTRGRWRMRCAPPSARSILSCPSPRCKAWSRRFPIAKAPRRFNTALISSFALAAVLLAALGIYSVIAFSAALREQEMAIRMALGSQRAGILGLVFKSAAKLAIAGCALGLLGAAAASQIAASPAVRREPV